MSGADTFDEIAELAGELFERRLDDVRAARLEQLVCEDAAARACYLEMIDLHADLHRTFANGRGQGSGGWRQGAVAEAVSDQRSADSQKDLSLEAADLRKTNHQSEITNQKFLPSSLIPHPLSLPSFRIPHSSSLLRRPLAFSLAVSTVATVVFLLTAAQIHVGGTNQNVQTSPSVVPRAFVAQLTDENDCRWGESSESVFLNAHLRAGQVLELREGLAEVTFKSGAKAFVEGPAMLVMKGKNEARLEFGKIVARVISREAVGFTIETPAATVIDLGTEFGVEVADEGNTNIVVFSGRVRTISQDSDPPRIVRAGGAARVLASGKWATPPPASELAQRFRLAVPSTKPFAVEGEPRLADKLLAYYQFEREGSDSSGNGRHLIFVGSAATVSGGLLGNALDLSANSSGGQFGTAYGYATRKHEPVFNFGTGDFTIQLWVKTDPSIQDEMVLIEQFTGQRGPGFTFYTQPGLSKLIASYDFHTATETTAEGAWTKDWRHVIARRAKGTLQYFLDGKAIETTNPEFPNDLSTTGDFFIGRRNGGQAFPFRGHLDEIALWGRALANREIAALYNKASGTEIRDASEN